MVDVGCGRGGFLLCKFSLDFFFVGHLLDSDFAIDLI